MTKKGDFIRPNDREASLIATRNLKMSRSPHAYVRGNTIKFYEWLEAQKKERFRTVHHRGSAVTAIPATSVRWRIPPAGSKSRYGTWIKL